MLKRGKTGRRLGLVAAAAAIGVMACTAIALAQPSEVIVAGPGESYTQPTYNTDQGVVVPFRNDGGTHNVTARQTGPDGKALFRSPTISGGTAGVDGTQYLSTGDYAFFCTVHPTTMNGTLHVTGGGTPVARPSATLKLKSRKISKALKKGLQVAVNASTKIDGVELLAKLGKTTIGKATVSLAAGPQVDVVKLNKAGKSKLRGKSSAKVSVTASIPFGSPASTKAKLS